MPKQEFILENGILNSLPESVITVIKNKISKLAWRLKQESTDIFGEKCIHNNEGKVALISSKSFRF